MRYRLTPFLLVALLTPPTMAAQVVDSAGWPESSAALVAQAEGSGVATPLPAESIYQLSSTWEAQSGATRQLVDFRGRPTLVVMFYGTCRHACPILFRNAKQFEEALTEEERSGLQVVMVTIDPQHDTLEDLVGLAAAYELDLSRWTLLRGDDAQTRELAAVLNIQYRGQADGQISHSNVLTLLDAQGVPVHRTEGLNRPVDPMVQVFRSLP
jgi:protein SCO1/2